MPSVFLDANVLLMGALDPTSNAGRLVDLVGRYGFVAADGTIAEAEYQIAKHAPDREIKQSAIERLHRYIATARMVVVPSLHGRGMGDSDWIAIARENHCSIICTYNLRDFRDSGLEIRTPESLHKTLGVVSDLIEVPLLGAAGTLFFSFRIYHPLNDFVLLSSGSGNVLLTGDGEICATGGGSTNNIHAKVRLGYAVNLVLRFTCGATFEVLDGKENGTREIVGFDRLTSGRFDLTPPIEAKLVFRAEHGFNGEVFLITGYPAVLSERRMKQVFRQGTSAFLRSSLATAELIEIWRNWSELRIW